MRKQTLALSLLAPLLLTGCASLSDGYIQGSASLSSNNFVYVENGARGSAKDVMVLGIGGGISKKETIVMAAQQDLMSLHPLRQNQAYTNMSVSFRRNTFFGIVNVRKCYVTADIVEFIPESGERQVDFKPSGATGTSSNEMDALLGMSDEGGDATFFNSEMDEGEMYRQYEVGDVTFEMVKVGGTFWGRTEVTQELWLAVMGNNPSYYSAKNGYMENLRRPVESVTKKDVADFLQKLNEKTKLKFRLPTVHEMKRVMDSEWLKKGDDFAWCKENSYQETHPVGEKQANELYDLFGNVAEYCSTSSKVYGGTFLTDRASLDKEVIFVGNARRYVGFRLALDAEE